MANKECVVALRGSARGEAASPLVLTVQQAATALKLAPNTVYLLAAQRKIPVLKIRGSASIRIPLAALERWVEANTEGGAVCSEPSTEQSNDE